MMSLWLLAVFWGGFFGATKPSIENIVDRWFRIREFSWDRYIYEITTLDCIPTRSYPNHKPLESQCMFFIIHVTNTIAYKSACLSSI